MLVTYVNQQAYFTIKICWKTSKQRQIKLIKIRKLYKVSCLKTNIMSRK